LIEARFDAWTADNVSWSRARLGSTTESGSVKHSLRAHARKTYWLEGGLIGAGVLGLAGALMAASLCNSDSGTDDCTGPVIMTSAVGAGVGMVVGSLIGAGKSRGK
jgi:uncharacterized membrane protein YeaQ/YmgE (transglycosylase-associated protein family)